MIGEPLVEPGVNVTLAVHPVSRSTKPATRVIVGAAGLPLGADIGSEQMVLMDRARFSPAPDYLLKVKGDSMRDEGIFEGDLIGVHRTSDARSGQIVVARIEDALGRHPGLELAGAAYRGVGIPDCIASGEAAAESVVRSLAAAPA